MPTKERILINCEDRNGAAIIHLQSVPLQTAAIPHSNLVEPMMHLLLIPSSSLNGRESLLQHVHCHPSKHALAPIVFRAPIIATSSSSLINDNQNTSQLDSDDDDDAIGHLVYRSSKTFAKLQLLASAAASVAAPPSNNNSNNNKRSYDDYSLSPSSLCKIKGCTNNITSIRGTLCNNVHKPKCSIKGCSNTAIQRRTVCEKHYRLPNGATIATTETIIQLTFSKYYYHNNSYYCPPPLGYTYYPPPPTAPPLSWDAAAQLEKRKTNNFPEKLKVVRRTGATIANNIIHTKTENNLNRLHHYAVLPPPPVVPLYRHLPNHLQIIQSSSVSNKRINVK